MNKQHEIITIPAGVDIHVHFREPGDNKSETIESGTWAAALGGYAAVFDMSNNPGRPTNGIKRVKEKHDIIMATAHIPVGTYAGRQPEDRRVAQLATMAIWTPALKSYMGKTTGNKQEYTAGDFEEIWRQWHEAAPDKPIMVHRGSADLEEIIAVVAKGLGHPLHICHVNDPEEVEMVMRAKARGLPVTCGVCPHHLFKTSHDRWTQGPFAEMMPPLAHQVDAEKLWHHFVKADIDTLETDHAPHAYEAKMAAERSKGHCFGVPGIEFAIPLLLRRMVKGEINRRRLIDATSTIPAAIMGIKLAGSTQASWELKNFRIESEDNQVKSDAGWTPYLGMLATGELVHLKVGGRTIVLRGLIKNKAPKVVKSRAEII